ncbi:MAG: hypothetical protein IKE75_04925 [Bacilli bacterium]|nr:hypothetical protein [Bacilli bacterium]
MRKKIIAVLLFITIVLAATYALKTFGLLRSSANATGSLLTAEWSVTRSQSASTDSIEVVPGLSTDTYDLTVTSNSEVDVKYTVIISNLPTGIEVQLDDGTFQTPSSGTIRMTNGGDVTGTINYNDATKTKTHTLTFRATSSAQAVSDQEIDIDVEFKQTV